jgi:hypothetical protein
MKLSVSAFCFSVSCLLLSGCATILNDEYQRINVTTSNGKEVKGSVDGTSFTAPSIITVKRTKTDKILMVEGSGCTKQTLLSSNVDPKFFINILSGGTFGSTTDYVSEKMWKYQESVVISCQ